MNATHKKKTAVKVLIAGTILQLFIGTLYVWSIFVAPISELLNWEESAVKLTSSFMLCFFVLGIIAGGKLITKLDSRIILVTGGIMLVCGMALTPLVPPSVPWLLYVTYGIIGGFGIGMAYNTILTASQQWFPERRGLAAGLCVSSFGFSAVIFAPIVDVLISKIGVVNTLYVFAAIILTAVLCLFSFIRLPDSSGEKKEIVFKGRQLTTFEAIKTKQFYYMTLAIMFCTATYFVLIPSLKSLAIERGLSAAIGTSVVMLAGIGNALGRLTAPIISEKVGNENMMIAIISTTAICSLLLIFVGGIALLPLIFVTAYCYGGPAGINPVLASDYFGLKYLGGNFGAIMLGFAASALIFPFLIGLIESESVRYIVLALISFIGAVLIVLLRSSRERWLSANEADQT